MSKIFLSYRRDDSAGLTGRIYDRLQTHFGREAVFMDIDSIPYGVDFRTRLSEAVRQCDVFLAIIADRWLRMEEGRRRLDDPNDFVRVEIETALTNKIPVIPVLIGRTAMPQEQELPSQLAELPYRTAAQVDPGRDFHSHVDRLIRRIAEWTEPAQPTPLEPFHESEDGQGIIVPKGLRAFDQGDRNFFLQLLPGPRRRVAGEDLPESIWFWKARLEETDPAKTFRVGLLYGPSGCGKSSLVRAGLIPHLDTQRVVPVYVEAQNHGTEARLISEIRRLIPDLGDDLGLADLLARLPEARSLAGRKVVLVIDQFEQWLHVHRAKAGTELAWALRQCDGLRLQGLLMVRTEFWVAISRFKEELGIDWKTSENTALADLFDQFHAKKVLEEFGRAYGRLPRDLRDLSEDQQAFLDQAVQQLADTDGRVICVRLALLAQMLQGEAWVPKTLKQVGGVEGVRVKFLERHFSPPTANPVHLSHRQAAMEILRALLPEPGSDLKGSQRAEHELQQVAEYEQRPDDFRGVLDILNAELRLITPTEQEEPAQIPAASASPGTDREKYYQLTHDYLVPALREWLTGKQKETWRGRAALRLEERTAQWTRSRDRRFLPNLFEYATIVCGVPRRKRTSEQQAMMRAATRRYSVIGSFVLLIMALLGWAGWEVHGRLQAKNLVDDIAEDARPVELEQKYAKADRYRRWAEPMLLNRLEEVSEEDWETRGRILLALVRWGHDSDDNIQFLEECLLKCAGKDLQVQKFKVFLKGLEPFKSRVLESLKNSWQTVPDPPESRKARFLAGVALAAYQVKLSDREEKELVQFLVDEMLHLEKEDDLRKIGPSLAPMKDRLEDRLWSVSKKADKDLLAKIAVALAALEGEDQSPGGGGKGTGGGKGGGRR